jgi:hypothetical protein
MSFESATRLEQVSAEEHRWLVPDGWQQGRGAFGGLVFGALMQAMASREADATRVARAFTGEICGPALPVASTIRTRVLRRGSKQTNVTATLEQSGEAVAIASAVLASRREVGLIPRVPEEAPASIPFERAGAIPVGPPIGPTFAPHYEYRPTGPLPFSGGQEPLVVGWVRESRPLSRVTAAALIARLDAYWPAMFSVEAAPRPAATVSYMAELFCDPAELDPEEPLLYRGRTIAQAGGYFVELRELWRDGRPVAFNQQSFALLG